MLQRRFYLVPFLLITLCGQRAFGKMASKRNDEATSFVFRVTIEGEEFSFPFSQQLFKLRMQ